MMDWTINLVKLAEKRVREDDRAAHKEEACVLRLHTWELEMKTRKPEENSGDKKAHRDDQQQGC